MEVLLWSIIWIIAATVLSINLVRNERNWPGNKRR